MFAVSFNKMIVFWNEIYWVWKNFALGLFFFCLYWRLLAFLSLRLSRWIIETWQSTSWILRTVVIDEEIIVFLLRFMTIISNFFLNCVKIDIMPWIRVCIAQLLELFTEEFTFNSEIARSFFHNVYFGGCTLLNVIKTDRWRFLTIWLVNSCLEDFIFICFC